MAELSDVDRELVAWLGARGSASALRSEVADAFGTRVADVGTWLQALEQRGLLQVLDPFGTEERCVLSDAGVALARERAAPKGD